MNAPREQLDISRESAFITGSRVIIAEYFMERLNNLRQQYYEILESLSEFDSGRYGMIEFTKEESEFLAQYFDVQNRTISVPITEKDWSSITDKIAENLRSSMAFDQVSQSLASIDIKQLAHDFFDSSECTLTENAFTFSAQELVGLTQERVLNGLDNLFADSLLPYLQFIKSEAERIETELVRSVRANVHGEYTVLQKSLMGENTRHMMINVSIDPSVPDRISMEFFNVPIVQLNNSNSSSPVIEFSEPDEDKAYNDPGDGAYPFIRRNKGSSIMSFFFGEPPYMAVEDLTHWAKLETKTGSFKKAIIRSEEIRKRFFDYINTFPVNEEIGLRVAQQGTSIPGLGIPEIIIFEVMTSEEIEAEKQKRDEEERRANKGGLGKLLNNVIGTVGKVMSPRKS